MIVDASSSCQKANFWIGSATTTSRSWNIKVSFWTVYSVRDYCPKNDLFHDPSDFIIMSRMAVSDLVDNDNDNILPLAILLVK